MSVLAPKEPQPRLILHIVHSNSFNVPVLLMQGCDCSGMLWTPESVRSYVMEQSRGQSALTASLISQIEHPVLHIPFCCLDPCGTSTLIEGMMTTVDGGAKQLGRQVDRPQTLDYLSAWWSVVAPFVGVRTRAVQYREKLLS